MDLLHPFDANTARRELRARLVAISDEADRDSSKIPHAFESEELLAYAERALRWKDHGSRDLLLAFLADAGTAFALDGRDADALALFQRGIKESRTDLERAEFHYLLGQQCYERVGDWVNAVVHYEETAHLIPAPSATRAEAYLGMLRAQTRLRNGKEARAAAVGAQSTSIGYIMPHVHLRLGSLYAQEDDLKVAERENREAKRLFEEEGNDAGCLAADADLGAMHLAGGNARKAYPLLVQVRLKRFELLDLSGLGMAYNNEGLALRKLGDLGGARDAYLQALRYHAETGQLSLLAATIRNLAAVLNASGEPDLALGALSEAVRFARDAGSDVEEFKALGMAMDIVLERKAHLNLAPRILSRGQALLDGVEPATTKQTLIAFARQAVEVAVLGLKPTAKGSPESIGTFPSAGAVAAVREIIGNRTRPELERTLTDRVRAGLRAKGAPSENLVARFLLSWAGSWFMRADYREEFALGQEQAKYHLRILRNQKIIHQTGTRKAAHYRLVFHTQLPS